MSENRAQAREALLSRRGFVTASGTVMSLAAFGLVGGAAAQAAQASEAAGASSPQDMQTGLAFDAVGSDVSDACAQNWEPLVAEEASADIVVVGTGMAGSAAMVSAAEQGASVIALEVNDSATASNGSYTDGVFEIGTDGQRDAAERYGVQIDPGVIISAEENFFNYRVNGLLWKDIMDHDADNLSWLEGHGVKFADTVDYYPDAGKYPTFRYWKDGTGTSGPNYIQPMHDAAAGLGVDVRYGVRARALGTDGSGQVNAVYAQSVADGTVTKIACKAVILAGGGYGCNMDMLAARGLDADNCTFWSMPGNMGDTLRMAVAVGGCDESQFHGYMDMQVVPATSGISLASSKAMWVNEDGDRFINEDCTAKTYDVVCPAMRTQQSCYIVLTKAVADEMYAGVQSQWISDFATDLEAAAGDPSMTVYQGDTPEEAAEAAGLDPARLAASVESYNACCAAGHDDEFGKAPELLLALDEGPYYVAKLYQQIYITVGGIATNRRFEVVDALKKPVPGLYAAGVDGIETYLELYNTSVSGGANANNINSGRYAAINAVETYVAGK